MSRSASALAGILLVPLALAPFAPMSFAEEEEPFYLAATETEALIAAEGRKVVVHGEAAGSGKAASGTNFVNFKGAEFSLVAFKSDLDQFPEGEPADLYEGRRLAVAGAVSVFRGKPQIKLTDPGQVTVLEPDSVFPPPAMEKPGPAAGAPKPETAEGTEKDGAEPAPAEAKRRPPVDASEYFKIKPAPSAPTRR